MKTNAAIIASTAKKLLHHISHIHKDANFPIFSLILNIVKVIATYCLMSWEEYIGPEVVNKGLKLNKKHK